MVYCLQQENDEINMQASLKLLGGVALKSVGHIHIPTVISQ